jgi:TonB family protein
MVLVGIYFAGFSGFKDKINVNQFKRILGLCLLAVLAAGIGGTIFLKAQVADIAETKRKVRVLAKPQYPELARKMNLCGVVKVDVTIGADGKVKRTHVVGGHPVFAAEAEKAAMQSEFEPGPRETSEIIEFKFASQ